MKEFKNNIIEQFKNLFAFVCYLIICTWWIWIIPLGMYVAYRISISDLPDWFKFWLLTR